MIRAEQGTKEWLQQRVGKVTASRFDDVLGKLKNGKGYRAERENYLWELVGEHLTGNPSPHYFSTAMMHGQEYEPHARQAFQVRTGLIVDTCGFLDHPEIPHCGASPDGIIEMGDGRRLGLEVKCPFNLKNHLQTVASKAMPEQHYAQVQGQMMCARLDGVWFVSYYPFVDERLKLFSCYVERNDDYIQELEYEVIKFQGELAQTLLEITASIPKS